VDWRPFDAFELVDHKSWPKKVFRRFFEINPLGMIRYLDPDTLEYRPIRPVVVGGRAYFVTTLGHSHGHLVVIRILIKDIVKRIFNS
jgi:hypothetical protein